MNYVVTDDDLSMLLSGTQWHDGAMKHLLGGEDHDREADRAGEAVAGRQVAGAATRVPSDQT